MHLSIATRLSLGLVFAAFVVSTPTAAAITYVNAGQTSYTLHTGDEGGHCVVAPDGGNAFVVSCSDSSDNSARLHSERGCIEIHGRSLCAIGIWDYTVGPLATLTCSNGAKFNVSTGTESADCQESEADGGSLTCSGPGPGSDQISSSSATCNEGCGNTSGAGCCCNLSSPNCKTTTTCH